jgi:hypothetical protein
MTRISFGGRRYAFPPYAGYACSPHEKVKDHAQSTGLASEELSVMAPSTRDIRESFGLHLEYSRHEATGSSNFANAAAIVLALCAGIQAAIN